MPHCWKSRVTAHLLTLLKVSLQHVIYCYRADHNHTGKCIRRLVVFGSNRYWCKYYIEKHAICQKDYRIRSFLSDQYVNGDLCKHLRIDSSTDPDRYSNLFLNAYINRHVHAQYLKMI